MLIDDAMQFTMPALTAKQFETVLNAAYLAEAEGLVEFDADLIRALNALSEEDVAS
jgi:hypothetical protein